MEMIQAYLIRRGWLREPMPQIQRCGWRMIAIGIAEATPHRRLSP